MNITHEEFEKEAQRRGLKLSRDSASNRYRVAFVQGSALVSLDNLEKDIASDGDLTRISRFMDTVMELSVSATDRITPEGLLWLLEPSDYVEKPELRVCISDKVDRVLVHLSPDRSAVTWVTQAMLASKTITEAAAGDIAFANLDRELSDAKVEFKQIGDVRLGFISATEPVKASLILSPGFRQKVEEVIGWPVLAVVPDRDFLYFWASRHEGFVGQVGRIVVEQFARAAYPISTEVYLIGNDGVRAIGEFPQNAARI
jgi:hypothetical protein